MGRIKSWGFSSSNFSNNSTVYPTLLCILIKVVLPQPPRLIFHPTLLRSCFSHETCGRGLFLNIDSLIVCIMKQQHFSLEVLMVIQTAKYKIWAQQVINSMQAC